MGRGFLLDATQSIFRQWALAGWGLYLVSALILVAVAAYAPLSFAPWFGASRHGLSRLWCVPHVFLLRRNV